MRGRYHGGRRPSSDDSFHSPTVIPPSALDKPSIMKPYYRRRTRNHTSPRSSPTMVTLYDTRFVESRWWNDGWTVKTVVTGRSSASMIPAPAARQSICLFIRRHGQCNRSTAVFAVDGCARPHVMSIRTGHLTLEFYRVCETDGMSGLCVSLQGGPLHHVCDCFYSHVQVEVVTLAS